MIMGWKKYNGFDEVEDDNYTTFNNSKPSRLLNKSEIPVILIGALLFVIVILLIVIFPKKNKVGFDDYKSIAARLSNLEQRLESIEKSRLERSIEDSESPVEYQQLINWIKSNAEVISETMKKVDGIENDLAAITNSKETVKKASRKPANKPAFTASKPKAKKKIAKSDLKPGLKPDPKSGVQPDSKKAAEKTAALKSAVPKETTTSLKPKEPAISKVEQQTRPQQSSEKIKEKLPTTTPGIVEPGKVEEAKVEPKNGIDQKNDEKDVVEREAPSVKMADEPSLKVTIDKDQPPELPVISPEIKADRPSDSTPAKTVEKKKTEVVEKKDKVVETTTPEKQVAEPSQGGTIKLIFHRVEKGETLYRISVNYGISVEELQELNNMEKDDLLIHTGQELIVAKERQ
jgi:LysM repeat protein